MPTICIYEEFKTSCKFSFVIFLIHFVCVLHVGMAHEIAVKHVHLIHEKDGDEMTPLQLLSCSPPVFGQKNFIMRMIYKGIV